MMISGPGTELEGDPGVATMSAIAETGAAPKNGQERDAALLVAVRMPSPGHYEIAAIHGLSGNPD